MILNGKEGTCSRHLLSTRKVTQPTYKPDNAVYAWFTDTRVRKVPLSGSVTQQRALNYACLLGLDDFKASTGWLNCFKARHNIIGKILFGELNFSGQ